MSKLIKKNNVKKEVALLIPEERQFINRIYCNISDYRRKGKTEDWIAKRINGKAIRNRFITCLMNHGVATSLGFKICTIAIYKYLHGRSIAIIRKKMNLPNNANIRDNMSVTELSAIEFIESLSIDSIERLNARGSNECESIICKSAKLVAETIMNSRKTIG